MLFGFDAQLGHLVIYLEFLSLLDMCWDKKCPPKRGMLIGFMEGHSLIMGIGNEWNRSNQSFIHETYNFKHILSRQSFSINNVACTFCLTEVSCLCHLLFCVDTHPSELSFVKHPFIKSESYRAIPHYANKFFF